MRNSIYVMGKDIPVSWIPLIPRMSGPDIRGISVYVKSTYTENSWALPWSGQQVVTRVETLIFSKYLVGSRANPWHGHVVGKSLILIQLHNCSSNEKVSLAKVGPTPPGGGELECAHELVLMWIGFGQCCRRWASAPCAARLVFQEHVIISPRWTGGKQSNT